MKDSFTRWTLRETPTLRREYTGEDRLEHARTGVEMILEYAGLLVGSKYRHVEHGVDPYFRVAYVCASLLADTESLLGYSVSDEFKALVLCAVVFDPGWREMLNVGTHRAVGVENVLSWLEGCIEPLKDHVGELDYDEIIRIKMCPLAYKDAKAKWFKGGTLVSCVVVDIAQTLATVDEGNLLGLPPHVEQRVKNIKMMLSQEVAVRGLALWMVLMGVGCRLIPNTMWGK